MPIVPKSLLTKSELEDMNMTDVRKEIQKALKRSGNTRYWLAKQTGIRPATVYSLIDGNSGINLKSLGKVLDVLGLEIRPKGK